MSAAELDAAGPPNSWLVPAVVSTLLCFPITGVIGVYFAAQVRVRWDLGDLDGADVAARRARLWTLLGFVIFLLLTAAMVATGVLFSFVDRVRQ